MQIAALFVIAATTATTAQLKQTENTMQLSEGQQSPKATLASVKWLRGEWVGEGLGGKADETWSAPMAGTMVGTFRLVSDGKLSFSEFFMLVEENGTLVLRLKHFDPRMKGWEKQDKFVEFRLVKVEGTTAWFEGLTYRLDGKGVLHAYVAMKGKDGTVREGEFTFKRRPAAR